MLFSFPGFVTIREIFYFSVYFCLFVCLKQRSKESLSEELVNMFQCTNTSKYSCVLIRLASIPGSGLWHIWQFILQLLDSHCGQTEGELILWTYKTSTLFHNFVWRCRVKNRSTTFIKNLINCHFLCLQPSLYFKAIREENPTIWSLFLLAMQGHCL